MKGRLSHILHAVYCEPWLITSQMHRQICDIVMQHITGEAHQAGGIASLFEDEPKEDILRLTDEGTAILAINGVIGKRVSALEKSSGMVDIDELSEAFDVAMADSNVTGIILDISSPGGTVTGVPELASKIQEARSEKPSVAVTDTMAASAAYWIGSQAWSFVASESAVVGSVGVYMSVLDESRAYEMAGYKQDVIKAGTMKGAGIPGTSLSSEQRDQFQGEVDYIHAQFKAAVRTGRGRDISDESMQGQDFYAEQAVELGLINAIGGLKDAAAMLKTWRK